MSEESQQAEKPFLAKFEFPLPSVAAEEFDVRATGTGPRSTSTGYPPNEDTNGDVDVDW